MRSRFRQVRWISLPNCAKRMKAITAAAATNGIVAHKGYQGARMRGIWGNLRMLRRRSRRRRQNPRRPSGLARCLVERLRRPNLVRRLVERLRRAANIAKLPELLRKT